MAEVAHLKLGQETPESDDWVMIKRSASDRYDISVATSHSRGLTIAYDSARTLGEALQRAEPEARRIGVSVIHVKDDVDAWGERGQS